MGRAVTKNAQGELEITESLSVPGSNPTIKSVKLIAKDGSQVKKENPDWLGFTQNVSGSDIDVILQLDATDLDTYTTYTFEIAVQDSAGNESSRRVNVGIGSLATSFDFKGIMGQEDKGRSDAQDDRVENGGTARIVLTTTMPATVDIYYVGNPPNVDDPTFTQTLTSVSSGKKYHEFFFPVNPSSVYAFEVEAEADFDQSVPTLRSETYYFVTGDQITFTDSNFGISVSLTIVPGVTASPQQTIGGSLADSTNSIQTPDGDDGNIVSSQTLASFSGVDITESQTISLDSSISVV